MKKIIVGISIVCFGIGNSFGQIDLDKKSKELQKEVQEKKQESTNKLQEAKDKKEAVKQKTEEKVEEAKQKQSEAKENAQQKVTEAKKKVEEHKQNVEEKIKEKKENVKAKIFSKQEVADAKKKKMQRVDDFYIALGNASQKTTVAQETISEERRNLNRAIRDKLISQKEYEEGMEKIIQIESKIDALNTKIRAANALGKNF